MKRLLCALALLLVAMSIRAADNPKPNTLTPKEIADGWLLLFDGETTFGWQADGPMRAEQGVLSFPADPKRTMARLNSLFGSYELQFEYKCSLGKEPNKHAWFHVTPRLTAAELYANAKRDWYRVRVQVGPTRVQAETTYPDKDKPTTESRDFKDQDVVTLSQVRFAIPPDCTLQLRNVKLRPLGAAALFNGKDLTGWKEHPGKKSTFSVDDGAIHIKNGPGDLQSEGQWADFVLQAECKTNGKNLNSGIFFRCLPGQYQQGYEAQIHNGFLPEATKEYTIEVYDPKTNALTGKQKEKYAAMDYGTGGVYRRMPARKQMSRDGEWFTMTVAAHGRHLATWVNGYPVVDWTDNRPVKDNARNGCKLEKGPISFQGHDPTTDLNFRNIRIAELPTDKK